MNTRVTSKIGNFTLNIVSFWDNSLQKERYKIKETQEVFPNHEKAMKRAKMILKKKRDRYCEKYHIVKRKRTKTKEVEKPEPTTEKDTWVQINITNDIL